MDNSQEIISLVHDNDPQERLDKILLPAAHSITGTLNKQPNGSNNLDDALKARLIDVKRLNSEFVEITEQELEAMDIDSLQKTTGDVAFKILVQISSEEQRGALRELSLTEQSAIRMLAALIFRWKLSKETDTFNASTPPLRLEALNRLQTTTLTLLKGAFPETEEETNKTSTIGLMIIKQHATDMLPSTFSLGWLAPGECNEGSYIRSSTLRLLSR